jgi:hypothetical protein
VGLVELQSIVYRIVPRATGLLTAPRLVCFHTSVRLTDRSSPAFRKVGSFSRAHLPLRSSFVRASFWPLSRPSALPGFLPSSRRHRSRPLNTGVLPLPLCSVHRLSQPLDDLLRLPASWAYSIPQPRSGLLRSRVSPDSQPYWLIASSSPHGVATLLLTSDRSHQLPLPGPSPSGYYSENRSVRPVRCLASPSVAPLFGFFLLQVFAGPP